MMMEEESDYEQHQLEEEDEEEEIAREDAWAVISAYFEEKGFVIRTLFKKSLMNPQISRFALNPNTIPVNNLILLRFYNHTLFMKKLINDLSFYLKKLLCVQAFCTHYK